MRKRKSKRFKNRRQIYYVHNPNVSELHWLDEFHKTDQQQAGSIEAEQAPLLDRAAAEGIDGQGSTADPETVEPASMLQDPDHAATIVKIATVRLDEKQEADEGLSKDVLDPELQNESDRRDDL
ncbi:hypothetical protein GE107_10235 [Cohnella sp. CFH 77786]|uniref:hypothetical protein n=1 Tax=Cohnella sp. CFH 77786 TaxID=2662265 RepID=UPI001C60F326|nr:hypothetical protein [Cohnella sp. CFH 77786]MBW5446438.1 hypothetical protein [Cohnella sp. CFH 77786]